MKSIHKLLLVNITLIFVLAINVKVISQVKVVDGVNYPDDYKTNNIVLNSNTKTNLNKKTLLPFGKIKGDFAVNNECGEYGANQLYPDIAMGEGANYICVWVDERTGAEEVLAQLYNAIGEKVFGLREISENDINWNVAPHAVFNKATGEYLITWADDSRSIVLQRLDRMGNKLGRNIRVSDNSFCNTNNPSVATDKLGNIMVTWVSQKSSSCSGSSIVFVRFFDKEMNPLSDQRTFFEDDERVTSVGRACRIASDTLGNFIVVWSGSDDNKSKIFLQKINTNQWLFEKSIIVSDSLLGNFPTISGTPDGYFLISWDTDGEGVAGRIFNSDSGFVSDAFMIDKIKTSWVPHSTSSDEFNNFYCGSRSWDSRLHKINKEGEIVDSAKFIDTSFKYSSMPKLSEGRYGMFYSVSYGSNSWDYDIHVERIDSSLVSSGVGFYIEDECSSPERKPVVKFNKDGNSIIVWEGTKDGTRNIYGETFDKDFNSTSGEILISDSSKYFSAFRPHVSTNIIGNFLVTFSEEYYSHTTVFRKISSTGDKIGANIELSTNYESSYIISNSDKMNNTMFCWSNGNYYGTVFYQEFDSNMKPVTTAKVLFTGDSKKAKTIKDFWVDEKLNILILWNDYDLTSRESDTDLKAIEFSKTGKINADTMIVYSGEENTRYSSGKCMINEEGNYIFAWIKWTSGGSSNNSQIFVDRKYWSNNKTYIDSFSINDSWPDFQIVKFKNKKSFVALNSDRNIYGYYLDDIKRKSASVNLQMLSPYYYNPFDLSNNFGCDIYNDKLFLAYELVKEKNRGIDIWANVQDFSDIYSEINNPEDINDASVFLYNPYPNPVVSEFTLNYAVSKISCVKFIVYNSIGQIVKKLDRGVKFAGVYYEKIDISNLSAGVYFISGIDASVSVKKFVVLK